MQDTFINPDWHVNCFYEDSEGCRIVIQRFGGDGIIDLSKPTEAAIKAALGSVVESHEGYDEDPSATIWFLYPNQLGEHLNKEEQQQLSASIVRMWHEAHPDAGSLFAPRNRGSMNVMNRIANKRRRKGGFF